jgi:hypothetical protein
MGPEQTGRTESCSTCGVCWQRRSALRLFGTEITKKNDAAGLLQLADDVERDAHQALWDARVTIAQIERECPSAFVRWKRTPHGSPANPPPRIISVSLDHYRPVHTANKDN